MQGVGVALAAVAALAVLLAAGCQQCQAAMGGGRGGGSTPEGGLTRPLRPAVFHTPEELRHYLDAVSNYYAVASRPGRFGKRSSPHRERTALQRRDAEMDNLAGMAPDREARDEEAVAAGQAAGLPLGLQAVPDYLFQFAPGPVPTPASEMYSLFMDQERLAQARPNQE